MLNIYSFVAFGLALNISVFLVPRKWRKTAYLSALTIIVSVVLAFLLM